MYASVVVRDTTDSSSSPAFPPPHKANITDLPKFISNQVCAGVCVCVAHTAAARLYQKHSAQQLDSSDKIRRQKKHLTPDFASITHCPSPAHTPVPPVS